MVASWSCTPLFADAHVGFDPAETSGATTPYIVLYALHDAMIRPSPGHPMAPSLAESWSASQDGLVYEFVLRKGVKFHNGDPHVDDRQLGLSLPEVVRASDGGRSATTPASLKALPLRDANRGLLRKSRR